MPGQRFRIEQWEPLLRPRGVEMRFAPFADEELQDTLYKPGRTARKLKLLGRALARLCEQRARGGRFAHLHH